MSDAQLATPVKDQVKPSSDARPEGIRSSSFLSSHDQQIFLRSTTQSYEPQNLLPQDPFGDIDAQVVGIGQPSAEQTGTVIDYGPNKVTENAYQLGMDYETTSDTRTPSQKLHDFVEAAAKRASDPGGQKADIQGELDKLIGIGEGLNTAKEKFKGAAAVGWKALTDGSVAEFLSKEDAINGPLFNTISGVLDTMAKDPNATNQALEALGKAILQGSEQYSALPNRGKGQFIGETMFGMINPEGSTEAGDLAIKIADKVATHVDQAVMDSIEKATKAIDQMAQSSPEHAQQAKQMLYEYLKGKGLTAQELNYAGIPKGYFDGVQTEVPSKGDYHSAMSSKSDGADNLPHKDAAKDRPKLPTGDNIAEHFRFVEAGENLAVVFREMAELSLKNDCEYTLVKRPDGRMELMTGGKEHIKFFEPISETIAHTHLNKSFELSRDDKQLLEALGQESTVIIDAHSGESRRMFRR